MAQARLQSSRQSARQHGSLQDSVLRRALSLCLGELIQETPLQLMHGLSQRLNVNCWLKREDFQPVNSFKLRGAYAKLLSLDEVQKAAGVICASAGNHAQGLALAGRHLSIPVRVVMPEITPEIKIDAVEKLGAQVIIYGEDFDAACAYAQSSQFSQTFVHPYDDVEVIAGQATVGLEIQRQCIQLLKQELDYLFIPIGGGGLAAGIATVFKYLSPHTRLIGVEAEESASMQAAWQAGAPVPLKQVGRFAEGVAVRQVGDLTYSLCGDLLNEIVTVDTDEICAATQDIYEDVRGIAEPAGALAVAGIKRFIADKPVDKDCHMAAILSGANVNFARLRHIAERAALGEEKEALFAVTIPERPGSFLAFCKTLGSRAITEFNYRYAGGEQAQIFVGVALKQGAKEKAWLVEAFRKARYQVQDLSGDEMAKLHIRHMVGGRASVAGERLYRFSFPERPGALLDFLQSLQADWNISLFHYRNHGSDYGRILMGIQVADSETFETLLKQAGYDYCCEQDNPAYSLFLKQEDGLPSHRDQMP